jgi:hypothetical protein
MLTRKKFAEIFAPTTSPAAAFTSRFVETRATANINNSSMNSQFRNDFRGDDGAPNQINRRLCRLL